MFLRSFCTSLGVLLLLSPRVLSADPARVKADEELLHRASLATDGPSLIDFFKRRTPDAGLQADVAALVKKLGAQRFAVREKASEELLKIGPPALPLLEKARRDPDLEVARRAENLVTIISTSLTPELITAAVRLLAVRKPEGGLEALLNFVPTISEEYVLEEARDALVALGGTKGKPAGILLKALADREPSKRAMAAEAVARLSGSEQRAALKEMLKDSHLSTRVRVAIALVELNEKEAIGVLIESMPQVDREQLGRIEEVLYQLAGEKAPKVSLGSTEREREKYNAAWAEWWKVEGPRVTVANLEKRERVLGHTILCLMEPRAVVGAAATTYKVVQLDRSNKPRWQISGLTYLLDARMVGVNKVAILSESGRSLSLRTSAGEVIWQKNLPTIAYGMHTLPNGNTFTFTRSQFLEYDRQGKEVFNKTIAHGAPALQNYVYAAAHAPNGDIIYLTRGGDCVRLDATGKELKRFSLGQNITILRQHIEALPNGNVLIPMYTTNKVVEYDPSGKQVWSATVQRPTSVQRLPNGNTVVVSRLSRQIVELDRQGTTRWSYTPTGTFVNAERR